MKFLTIILPELSESEPVLDDFASHVSQMTGGNHVLELVASPRHETLCLALSVGTLTGFPGQHNAHVLQVMALKN